MPDASSAEFEQPGNPEIIQLDEEFKLFDKRSITTELSRPEEFMTDKFLRMPGNFIIPINWWRWESSESADFLNPDMSFDLFNPENGYRVTQEDYSIDTRKRKIEEIIRKQSSRLHKLGKAAEECHYLGVKFLSRDEIGDIPNPEDEYLIKYVDSFEQLKSTNPDLLSRLRMQIITPAGIYEGDMHGSEFYPSATGPLPEVSIDGDGLKKGHPIQLPASDDIEFYSKIKAKFVLAGEGLEVDYRKGLDPDSFVPPRLRGKTDSEESSE